MPTVTSSCARSPLRLRWSARAGRGVQGAAVCGCHASDWEKVQMMVQATGGSRPFQEVMVPGKENGRLV